MSTAVPASVFPNVNSSNHTASEPAKDQQGMDLTWLCSIPEFKGAGKPGAQPSRARTFYKRKARVRGSSPLPHSHLHPPWGPPTPFFYQLLLPHAIHKALPSATLLDRHVSSSRVTSFTLQKLSSSCPFSPWPQPCLGDSGCPLDQRPAP